MQQMQMYLRFKLQMSMANFTIQSKNENIRCLVFEEYEVYESHLCVMYEYVLMKIIDYELNSPHEKKIFFSEKYRKNEKNYIIETWQ